MGFFYLARAWGPWLGWKPLEDWEISTSEGASALLCVVFTSLVGLWLIFCKIITQEPWEGLLCWIFGYQ